MLLKDLLKTRGVKQKWLSQKIGVSEVTVSNWVMEKSTPSQKNLEKLCELLNVSSHELIH